MRMRRIIGINVNDMKNKHAIGILLLLAATMPTAGSKNGARIFDLNDSPPPKKPIIPKGCKEYTFYGHTVIALNENRARKKCKKLAGC